MNASVDYVFPEKYRILSGSALKMIAVITMLIDMEEIFFFLHCSQKFRGI